VTATAPPRVAVVDHGAGNLVSIEQALTTVGLEVLVVRDPAQLSGCDALVVPGVGAAEPAMATLRDRGLVQPVRDWIAADRPYLGICLGMQLLFGASEEDGAQMLGVLRGDVRRLLDAPTLPHIGWNDAVRTRRHPLFDGIAPDATFYFVHSYAGAPTDEAGDAVLASTTHGASFVSAVSRGRTLGVQFHPERSGRDGLRLLSNFRSLVASHRDALAVPA
jgi:imidazole glycerol phosphate synthase glutamine amidotransferase subunit